MAADNTNYWLADGSTEEVIADLFEYIVFAKDSCSWYQEPEVTTNWTNEPEVTTNWTNEPDIC